MDVADGAAPQLSASTESLLADEDDLAGIGNNDSAPGDNDAVLNGSLTFTAGPDELDLDTLQLSVGTDGDTGLTTLDGTAITTTWDSDSNTLIGHTGDQTDPVFEIVVDNISQSGEDYSLALFKPVKHSVSDTEDNVGFTVDVSIRDSDGTEGTTSFGVEIDDDIPVINSIEDLTVPNEAGTTQGIWSHGIGADGYSADSQSGDVEQGVNVILNNAADFDFIVNTERTDNYDGNTYTGETLTAYIENDEGEQVEYFNLTVNTDGTYDFELTANTPTEKESVSLEGAIGGNSEVLYAEEFQADIKTDIRFTARDPQGNTTTVNSSANGIGVGSNPGGLRVGLDEVLKLQFLEGDQDGDDTTHSSVEKFINSIDFVFEMQSGGSADIEFTLLDINGAPTGTSMVITGVNSGDPFAIDASDFGVDNFYGIEIKNVGGDSFLLESSEVTTELSTEDVPLDFTVDVVDGDGDTASEDFNVTIEAKTTEAESLLLVGDNEDTTTDTDSNLVVGVRSSLTGDAADDILIGDVGGGNTEGKVSNIILVLDASGSMDEEITFDGGTMTRMEALKASVTNLLTQLGSEAAQTIRVHIEGFANTGIDLGTFDIVQDGQLDQAALDQAIASVNSLNADGGTNYEAGLQGAIDWVNGGGPAEGGDAVNQTIFVSDGVPTYYYQGNDTDTVAGPGNTFSQAALDHITGSYDVQGKNNDDDVSEVEILESIFGPTEAVGINVTGSNLDHLSVVEGEGDGADSITTAEELNDVLASLNPFLHLDEAGSDEFVGGDGNDIIFGDTVNTDALADAQGLPLSEGSGWGVFQTLENGQGTDSDWTRANTIEYLRDSDNHGVLASPTLDGEGKTRSGGHDTIDGGAGNDIIFGQEGDDLIIGGLDDDILSGGTGRDTFKWNEGETGTDTITDFEISTTPGEDGDVIDLSDLLEGADGATTSQLDDYLNFASDGTDTTITISANGDVDNSTDQTVVVKGHDLTGGGSQSDVDIITSLVNNQQLVTE